MRPIAAGLLLLLLAPLVRAEPPPVFAHLLVNVNAADEAELAQVPGLDRQLAKFLVARRLARGDFTSLDDVASALGPERWARAREFVSLGDGDLPPGTQAPLAPGRRCTVLEVLDGRTLRLQCGAKAEVLRLVQVTPPDKGQPGQARAVEGLRRIVKCQQVWVFGEKDGADDRDAEGRLTGWAQAFDAGMTVNEQLVYDGFSRAPAATVTCRRCTELREREDSARSAWVGFWQRQGFKPLDRRDRD